MKTIIFATKNEGKIREVREIIEDAAVLTMNEAGLDPEIIEDGTTFTENAVIKVKTVYEAARAMGENAPKFDYIMADDSGMEIDFFDKKPGVYSARWLGEDTSYDIKNAFILRDMENVPDEKRTARYVCVIAAIDAAGEVTTTYATAEGRIAHAPSGHGGFGYDPIFEFPGMGTFGDLTPEQKNAVSHRGKALRLMKEALQKELQP